MGRAFSQPLGHGALGVVLGGRRRHLGEILTHVVVHDRGRLRRVQHILCLCMGHHASLAARRVVGGRGQCGGFGRRLPLCGMVGVQNL